VSAQTDDKKRLF